jgi:flagellar biosynthetic protein FlhB
MADDAGEKTEDPTDQQYRKAREEGNVAKSRELTSGIVLTLTAIFIFFYFPYFVQQCEDLMLVFLQLFDFRIDTETIKPIMFFGVLVFGKMLLLPFIFFLVITFISEAAQVGLVVTPKAISPKWEKINFFQALPQFFAIKRKAFDLVKSLLKVIVLSALTVNVINNHMDTILRMTDADVMDSTGFMGTLLFELFFKIALVVLILGVIDFAYQKWQHKQDLRMTKQQIKEEYKQMEGDPIIKQRIREMQRENARKRMMDSVPTADVVIANPIHYAIALKYDAASGSAPICVAKGQRLMALKIKDIAREHGIYIHEDPPLAQTLFKTVEIGEQIPENLYKAVAEIIAIVYSMKNKR